MNAILQCQQLVKQYHQGDTTVDALRGVDLSFHKGEFVAISGPSGSGKSTLLHIIGSLEEPTSGQLILDGVSLFEQSSEQLADLRLNHIGFIFQAYNLIPVLSAAENIEFLLQLQGVDAKTRRARSTELLHQVGLDGLGDRKPGQLSGGQQQRVAVARALASRPTIVLADEPTANLDSKNSDELLALMSRLNEESQVTIIVATHDPKVIAHTKRHIVLTDGQVDSDQHQAA
ncbi:ABC transporter ATP-binding protein [Gallaecimonas sp. GXIMD1310]|uniref:ABC transporter ATP-binding protein n=1 Tax=Gallaecimonas sp. GXIMD1310 TaxID=3131926 RepID=UPI00325315A1